MRTYLKMLMAIVAVMAFALWYKPTTASADGGLRLSGVEITVDGDISVAVDGVVDLTVDPTATDTSILNADVQLVEPAADTVGTATEPLTPVLEEVTKPLEPVVDEVTKPLEPVLTPINEQVIAPVTEVVTDVTAPLEEKLQPVNEVLDPVLEQVAPVLEVVTDVTAPVTDTLAPLQPVLEPVGGLLDTGVPVGDDVVDPILEPVDPQPTTDPGVNRTVPETPIVDAPAPGSSDQVDVAPVPPPANAETPIAPAPVVPVTGDQTVISPAPVAPQVSDVPAQTPSSVLPHEQPIVVLPAHGTTVAADSETRVATPAQPAAKQGPTVEQPANLYVPQVTTTAPIVPSSAATADRLPGEQGTTPAPNQTTIPVAPTAASGTSSGAAASGSGGSAAILGVLLVAAIILGRALRHEWIQRIPSSITLAVPVPPG
ncbi:MAG: hypothetical protein M9890_14930 [Thermomicrobiales bacterium]|nr:hypothetical protein [Thermomicrobiales bacterium]